MKIIKLSSKSLNEAIRVIKKGGVVMCPTDTVYGLVADATSKKAVNKIYKIKKRQKTKPLGVFVKNIEMIKKIAFIDSRQEKFLKKNLPGKLTVILKKRPDCGLADLIGTKTTVGIRIIKNNFVNKLLEKLGKPLAQTSANISGKSATTKIGEALSYCGVGHRNKLGNKKIGPDLVIDAGDLPKMKPSKIFDLSGKVLTRLR